MVHHVSTNHMEAGTILIPEKLVSRARNITRAKEGHVTMINGLIHQGDIIILKVYSPNNRPSEYTEQKLKT